MTEQGKIGPQYPAQEGAVISGDPAQNVEPQGVLGGHVTCDRSQRLSPGPLDRSDTGETSAAMPSTAEKPSKRATPVEVGPPPSVPLGPSPKTLARREKQRAKRARQAGAQTLLTTTTSQQTPAATQGGPEAGPPEGAVRPGSPESEVPSTDTVSQGISEEEDTLLASSCEEAVAEAKLVPSNLAEGTSGKPTGTATGTKRKTEAGPTPPQATRKKKKKKQGGPSLGQSFAQAEESDLLGVVLVQDHPYTVLRKAQLDHLREELMKQLDAAIDSQCNRIPQFQESGVRHGRFHISCSDEYSYQWLQTTVDSITVPSGEDGKDDYQLKLVTSC